MTTNKVKHILTGDGRKKHGWKQPTGTPKSTTEKIEPDHTHGRTISQEFHVRSYSINNLLGKIGKCLVCRGKDGEHFRGQGITKTGSYDQVTKCGKSICGAGNFGYHIRTRNQAFMGRKRCIDMLSGVSK